MVVRDKLITGKFLLNILIWLCYGMSILRCASNRLVPWLVLHVSHLFFFMDVRISSACRPCLVRENLFRSSIFLPRVYISSFERKTMHTVKVRSSPFTASTTAIFVVSDGSQMHLFGLPCCIYATVAMLY